MAGNAVELCQSNLVEEILRGEEVDALTVLQRSHSQTNRQMRFSDAGRPKEHDVLGMFDKGGRLQRRNRLAIKRGLRIELE